MSSSTLPNAGTQIVSGHTAPQTLNLTPALPSSLAARMRWAISDTLTIAQRSMRNAFANPASGIIWLFFPVLMVVMYGFIFGGAMNVPGGADYLEYLMPGMFVMTMIFGLSETMVYVTTDAEKGVTDRFRSMPMSPVAVVAGRCTWDMLYTLLMLGILLVCGWVVGWQWRDGLVNALVAIGLLLWLRFAMLWVGIYLGLVIRGAEATAAVQVLIFPLTMITNAFAPTESMPRWLGPLAEWNPVSATVSATRDLFGNPGAGSGAMADNAILLAIVWPLLVVAIFAPLSVRQYRRLSR